MRNLMAFLAIAIPGTLLAVLAGLLGSSSWFWLAYALVASATLFVIRVRLCSREPSNPEYVTAPTPVLFPVPEKKIQPADGKTRIREGEMTMGLLLTFFAALSWVATMVIVPTVTLVPAVRAWRMPETVFDGTVYEFYLAFGYYGLLGLVVLNLFSAWRGSGEARKFDFAMTALGMVVMTITSLLFFVLGIGREGITTDAINILVATTVFGFIDFFPAQGENRRDVLAQWRGAPQGRIPVELHASSPAHPGVAAPAASDADSQSRSVVLPEGDHVIFVKKMEPGKRYDVVEYPTTM